MNIKEQIIKDTTIQIKQKETEKTYFTFTIELLNAKIFGIKSAPYPGCEKIVGELEDTINSLKKTIIIWDNDIKALHSELKYYVNMSDEEYLNNIEKAKEFFEGKSL